MSVRGGGGRRGSASRGGGSSEAAAAAARLGSCLRRVEIGAWIDHLADATTRDGVVRARPHPTRMLRLASTSSLQDHLFDPDALQRVSKLMAWRGLCSRREAEVLIARGEVLVDGVVVEQGAKATREARIELAGANADSWLETRSPSSSTSPRASSATSPAAGEMEASALVTTRNARGSTNRQSTERAAAAAETSALERVRPS